MSRIPPLHAPYEPETKNMLDAMMPPGIPPLVLFRTFANNKTMTLAMATWGGYALSGRLSLSMRDRELVIDRVCALCRCEYEWGVHVAFFAERVGLAPAQVTSITHGMPTDPCWPDPRDRAIIEATDELHASATISDSTWSTLRQHLSNAECLDLTMLAGWYHSISFTANAAGVELEDGVPRFADVAPAQVRSR